MNNLAGWVYTLHVRKSPLRLMMTVIINKCKLIKDTSGVFGIFLPSILPSN